MSEDNASKNVYEKRIASCPIHSWTDIDDYLTHAQVPDKFWKPFHELILIRGESPKNITDADAKIFGLRAIELVNRYNISPIEGQALNIIFRQLVQQWIISGIKNN
jgi:hypothetical protein